MTPKTLLLTLSLLALTHTAIAQTPNGRPAAMNILQGTWELVYADVLHPDGTRTHDYGNAPKGQLQIDSSGRYGLFIFSGERAKFAGNDRKRGTPAEFKAAIMSTSSHYGTVDVDQAKHTLTFHIKESTYPNWEGTTQVRKYVLKGDTLSYDVPPRSNGDIPMTGWKRVRP
ncbi:MAG: lipocalin-like domain-containing protein [Rhodanobacteraceae bacterium]